MCVCVLGDGGRECVRVCVYMWAFSTARRTLTTHRGESTSSQSAKKGKANKKQRQKEKRRKRAEEEVGG